MKKVRKTTEKVPAIGSLRLAILVAGTDEDEDALRTVEPARRGAATSLRLARDRRPAG